MSPWSQLDQGERRATHYINRRFDGPPECMNLRVQLTHSGSWQASVQLEGACFECLGDNYPSMVEAMARCERYVLC